MLGKEVNLSNKLVKKKVISLFSSNMNRKTLIFLLLSKEFIYSAFAHKKSSASDFYHRLQPAVALYSFQALISKQRNQSF